MGAIILMAGLALHAVCDILTKKIPLVGTILLGVAGIAIQIIRHEFYSEAFLALIPGVICLLLAWLSREQVGYGDGALILAIGCYLDWGSMLGLCMLALSLAGLYALILVVVLKKGKNYEIPFAPFLFVGFCIERWLL